MTLLEFIASIIGSLAWPAALVAIALVLREPLKRVLLTLTRVKYKEMEIDFGRELEKVAEQAHSIDVKPVFPLPTGKEKDSSTILGEAARLVEEFPEPAVALAWSAVERELMAAVMRLAISPDYPPHNVPAKNIQILREHGLIDQSTYDLLNRMRNLRNIAVHGHGGAGPVTADQAREFLALAGGVVERLKSLNRKDHDNA